MYTDFFDVMRKRDDGTLIWVEAVNNVETAKKRIANLRSTAPGEYAIFDQSRQQIVAYVMAEALKSRSSRSRKEAGGA
jgi:hypothetical protein